MLLLWTFCREAIPTADKTTYREENAENDEPDAPVEGRR